MVRPVILRLEIDADDPLGQRIRGLPHLIKISPRRFLASV